MSTESVPPVRSTVPLWLGVALALSLWLLARPYAGLRHDGILYLGQSLLHLNPAVMSRDIFFLHGSQDSFTIFSRLLAQLYGLIDLGVLQVLILAACHVALMGAVWVLLRALGSPLQAWLGLCAAAVMSHAYGGWGIFAFAERFVTARTLAEPLVAWALVALVSRRWGACAVLMAMSMLVHPLIGLGAVAVVLAWMALRDRRAWLLLAAAGALALAAAWAGLPLAERLLQRYDDVWWSAVERANGQVLVGRWRSSDWQTVVFDLGVLVTAARLLSPPLARLCAAVAIACVATLLLSYLGADLARSVLITQLQLWRVLWVAHLLAVVLLPAFVLRAWALPTHGRLLALALGCAAVAVNVRWSAGWVFMGWTVAAAWLCQRQPPLSLAVVRLMQGATALALIGLSVSALDTNADLLLSVGHTPDAPTLTLLAATLPTAALPLAWAALVAGGRARWQLPLALLVGAALVYGLAQWDRRSALTRHVESSLLGSHPFQAHIPREAQVYWEENVHAVWAMLGRASFMSDGQAAGLLFNRETALEVQRRRPIFDGLRFQEQVCASLAALNQEDEPAADCWPTLDVVERICQAEQGPDFLVFRVRLARGVVAEWSPDVDAGRKRTYYLYDCLQLR